MNDKNKDKCNEKLYIEKIDDFLFREIKNQENIIVIPKFQRQYCWNEKHFENFFEDFAKDKKDDYFLGTYIVSEEDKKLLVIDGQQRLITTLILLISLYASYKEMKKLSKSDSWINVISKAMHNKEIIKFEYEYHNKSWIPIVKIFSNMYEENNYQIPETEIKEIINKKDSISKCFSYFFDKLSNKNDNERDIILNNLKNLKFCIFKINSEKEAILNFLKVNTIIQPLKKFDIFKGKIYEKYKGGESENISKKLNKIQEKIKYDDLDKFLTFFVTCKIGRKIAKSELDSEASGLINEKIENFIEELEKYSLIYSAFLYKSENNFEKEIPAQLKRSFYLIKDFGYKQIMPIFTVAFFKIKNLKQIEKNKNNILNIFKNLMNKILIHMIYKQVIQGEKGTGPRSVFNELIKQISKLEFESDNFEKEVKEIFNYINKDSKYDESSLEKYIVNIFYENKKSLSKKIIKWILFEYYSDLVKSKFLLEYEKDYDFLMAIVKNKKITVEHIIDENIKDINKYIMKDNGEIDNNLKKYIKENEKNINKIWNLTFLSSNLNSKLGTDYEKNFFNKINYYKNDNSSFLNKEIDINKIEKEIKQYDFLQDRKMKIIDFVTKKLFV